MKKALILTDNEFLYNSFIKIVKERSINDWCFDYACSTIKMQHSFPQMQLLTVKENVEKIITVYSLIISVHFKQLIPDEILQKVKCINIHPGFNPYNRGWYPQVFSIINGMPIGATIHEIDSDIDHGDIIDQVKVISSSWDTSFTLYNKVVSAEVELIEKNLLNILQNTYETFKPHIEGNLNLKKDFNNLRLLDLEETMTARQFLNRLRALTHAEFSNLYYIDDVTQKKVFCSIKLEPEING